MVAAVAADRGVDNWGLLELIAAGFSHPAL
jgi:hypothetical protein